MRLITIGRSKSSTIHINNEYVSSNHAQLLILDNGEMLLTDCGSLHGTYLNGKKIEPHIEVPVKKGDKIDFDSVPLNWASIPSVQLPDPTVVKGIWGVGKAKRNKYILSGESVSRYHATFKEMKNGKWYINDHSSNGTYINGQRIPSNVDYKITHSDNIICGTVPCPNPVTPPTILNKVAILLGSIAAVLLLVFGVSRIMPSAAKIDPYKATVLVTEFYNIKVIFDNDILEPGQEWYISRLGGLTTNPNYAYETQHYGTAFFISEEGLMLTNKHVTNALYADERYENKALSDQLATIVENFRQEYLSEVDVYSAEEYYNYNLWNKSSFRFEVTNCRIGIRYPGRTYSSTSEFDWAHIVDESDNAEVDVAAIRLNTRKTPEFADYFRLEDAVIDMGKLKMDDTYYTIGFPAGPSVATSIHDNSYEPTSGKLHLAQRPSKYCLFMTGDETVGGCSGSAIYDSKKRLVGVLWGGLTTVKSTTACPISCAVDFVKEIIDDDSASNEFKATNTI